VISPGQRLYEKARRHEPDLEPWQWLDQEVREFWERIAKAVGS